MKYTNYRGICGFIVATLCWFSLIRPQLAWIGVTLGLIMVAWFTARCASYTTPQREIKQRERKVEFSLYIFAFIGYEIASSVAVRDYGINFWALGLIAGAVAAIFAGAIGFVIGLSNAKPQNSNAS